MVYRLSSCLKVASPTPRPGDKLAINNDGRHALNALLICPCGDVRLMHVVDFDAMAVAGNTPCHVDGLATDHATSTEDLDLPPLSWSHQFHSPLAARFAAARAARDGAGFASVAGATVIGTKPRAAARTPRRSSSGGESFSR